MTDEIVQKAQQGDKQAMELLYTKNVQRTYRYILSNISDTTSAEDLTSTVFAKAFTNLAAFKGDASFATWLYAITRNELYKYYTEKKIATDIFAPFEEDELADIIEEESLDNDIIDLEREKNAKKKVDLLLSKLPYKYSEILRLRYLMNMSFSEVALAMGITKNYAKVLHNRAIKKSNKLYQ